MRLQQNDKDIPMTLRRTTLPLLLASALGPAVPALAQDVPGIEICTAEKDMTRRTSCLQSNVEFLKTTMTRMGLDQQRKLDEATRQIETLKASVAALQKTVAELQAALPKPAPAAPKEGASDGAKPPAKDGAK